MVRDEVKWWQELDFECQQRMVVKVRGLACYFNLEGFVIQPRKLGLLYQIDQDVRCGLESAFVLTSFHRSCSCAREIKCT